MTYRVLDVFSGCGAEALGFRRAGMTIAGLCEIKPWLRDLLRRHFPGTPIHDDIRTHPAVKADILVGGPPCFPAGTLILTRNGLIDISEIRSGDEVWTHRGRWRRVTESFPPAAAEIITMKGLGHPCLRTTSDHPFLSVTRTHQSTRRSGKAVSVPQISEPEWKAASQMAGRFWASPAIVKQKIPVLPDQVRDTEAFFWVLGRWLADGWVTSYKRKSSVPQGTRGSRVNSMTARIIWCAAEHKAPLLAQKLSQAGLAATRSTERTTERFTVQSAALFKFMNDFGKGAAGKTVPAWVIGAENQLRSAFLDGYSTGDGSPFRDGWKATTVSKAIAVGVRLLAISLGYSVAIHFFRRPSTCVIEGREVSQQSTWSIVALRQKSGTSSFESMDGSHHFALTRSVTPENKVEQVFNFEVEEDNSYVADGIIVHNCQRTSIAAAISGTRTGETLWPAMFRLGLNMGAEWIIVEQPPKNKAWETKVARDLASAGFHAARTEFEAADLGAPHQRRRVFILANRDLQRLQSAWSRIPSEIESVAWGALAGNPWIEGVPRALRVASGPAKELDRRQRIEAIGDANPPIMATVIARAILSLPSHQADGGAHD